jgi:tetratricopeptide (TPR) repeat protein
MKNILLCLFLGVPVFCLHAQEISFHGRVLKYIPITSAKDASPQYIFQATVSCQCDAQDVLTETDGRFELKLIGTSRGQSFTFNVKKENLEVVNPQDLNAEVGMSREVKVYLAESDKIDACRMALYDISWKKYEQKFLANTARLNKAIKSLSKSEEEKGHLRDSLRMIENERDKARSVIADMSKKYSRMQYVDMDSISREIFKLFQDGEFKKASELFDKSQIERKKRIEALEIRTKTNEAEQSKLNYEIDKLIWDLEIGADLKRLENKYKEALKIYDDIKRHKFDYGIGLKAEFHVWLRQFDSAIALYKTINSRNTEDLMRNDIKLGQAYRMKKAYDSAIVILSLSLDMHGNTSANDLAIRTREIYLKQQKSKKYTSSTLDRLKGGIYHQIGEIKLDLRQESAAKEDFEKARQIRDTLARDKNATGQDSADLARTLQVLAYTLIGRDNALAEKYLLTSQDIFGRLQSKNYQDKIANGHLYLAYVYEEEENLDKAEQYFHIAESQYQDLKSKYYLSYEAEYVKFLQNIASFYLGNKQKPDLAIAKLQEAISIQKQFAQRDFLTYTPDLIKIYNTTGIAYTKQKNWEEAEKAYLEAYELSSTSSADTITTAKICYNLAVLAETRGRLSAAYDWYSKSIFYRKKRAYLNPIEQGINYRITAESYADLCDTLCNIETYSLRKKEYLQKRQEMRQEAVDIQSRVVASYEKQNSKDLAQLTKALACLAYAYLQINAFDKARTTLEKSQNIRKDCQMTAQAQVLYWMIQKNEKEAKAAFQKLKAQEALWDWASRLDRNPKNKYTPMLRSWQQEYGRTISGR